MSPVNIEDLDLFPNPDGPRPGAPKPRRCLHGRRWINEDGIEQCLSCGKELDPETARRGKNNRARGNSIEREVAKTLGLKRVGMYGGPEDVSGELFVAQVKSGRAFPERLWTWLRALPANAGQTPILVITDAPGPGHKRRALVVLELDQWVALHGEKL